MPFTTCFNSGQPQIGQVVGLDGCCRALPAEIVYSILKHSEPALPLMFSRFVRERGESRARSSKEGKTGNSDVAGCAQLIPLLYWLGFFFPLEGQLEHATWPISPRQTRSWEQCKPRRRESICRERLLLGGVREIHLFCAVGNLSIKTKHAPCYSGSVEVSTSRQTSLGWKIHQAGWQFPKQCQFVPCACPCYGYDIVGYFSPELIFLYLRSLLVLTLRISFSVFWSQWHLTTCRPCLELQITDFLTLSFPIELRK